LEFFLPTVKRVHVAGSFNGWSATATPLAPSGNGRWLRDLWLAVGCHEYLFVVDGEWLYDPRATDYVPNVLEG
jgi:1,4-alpha-glucan branching enzyme